ncbi:MAG: hypothetical protein WBS33_06195 [Verrucomicrobiia bacterium]
MTFDRDDAYVLKALFVWLLEIEKFQVASAKYFLAKQITEERGKLLREELGRQTDSVLVERLKSEISSAEQEQAASFLNDPQKLRSALMRLESDHEKLEAMMAEFNRLFPDLPAAGN